MPGLSIPVATSDHGQGGTRARVTLVECGDCECSYCGLAFPVVQRVQACFGEHLRFVFRHLPLTGVHPLAEGAAETAEFAGAHEKFWAMHDRLYRNQDELGTPLYLAIAASLGLSELELRAALAGHLHPAKINSDFDGGVRSGVNGTPAFFINGQRHDAPCKYADLCAAIKAQLAMA